MIMHAQQPPPQPQLLLPLQQQQPQLLLPLQQQQPQLLLPLQQQQQQQPRRLLHQPPPHLYSIQSTL